VLSATCDAEPSTSVQNALQALPGIVITQGFIASDTDGQTVLLGRGGSDTSGAYFAGLLAAKRLEIWTDVPGMFSANPKDVPTARLLRELHYDEAQEIASSGAKVLHPRCILPVRQLDIPIYVYDTHRPDFPGTRISSSPPDSGARVKAIALKKGITLVSMDSPGMWHQVGFLADAFAVFKAHGLSIDLISTSETNVTVSLDPAANSLVAGSLDNVIAGLLPLCRAKVIGPCASVSLVGRNIRGILHKLGDALALFEDHKVYLVSQAANDLNFTLVIDEQQGERLVAQLHDLLIQVASTDPVMGDPLMGATWEYLQSRKPQVAVQKTWWQSRQQELLVLMAKRDAAYVYDLDVVRSRARALSGMRNVARVFYAMKANANADILRTLAGSGVGFECVSRGEVEHVLSVLPDTTIRDILFTPNFATRAEYHWAIALGLRVTVDNMFVLREWGEMFRGKQVFLRIDTGVGKGHHHHVRTAGLHSKFGIPLFEIDEAAALCAKGNIEVCGLHAHSGSGIFEVGTWAETARALAEVAKHFPAVTTLDLGGGLGVPDRAAGAAIDLNALDRSLGAIREEFPQFALWLEPGRFLVASAGVLLAKVTQVKGKGDVHYAGIATGMNSLIRPALYGAYHSIANLSRLGDAVTRNYVIVGPICETGDTLGHDRQLPECREGDVLLIDCAGAYGYAMSSNYNKRAPAEELTLSAIGE
jgi:bifunctional diaminopimelate decarboxylase / aspartate kinase